MTTRNQTLPTGGGFGHRRNIRQEPEERLLLAVLEQAVACLAGKGEGRQKERAFREARRWVLSREKRHPFCFETICEVLDWNPEQIRERLLSRRRRNQ